MTYVSQRTQQELSFPTIVEALAFRTSTPRGKERAESLTFLRDEAEVRLSLVRIEQARELLRLNEPIPVAGADDVRVMAERAEKGAVLSPEELLACGRLMRASRDVRSYFRTRKAQFPELGQLGDGLADQSALIARIDYTLEPSGMIRDSASDALASYRKRARNMHGQIRSRLEELLADTQFGSYLQEQYFSVRNDRYVVPVNASFRAKVPGIVHNASQTGLTIFIEPQILVDLGNELAIAESLALEEERRILAELSEAIGDHAGELGRAVEILAGLDVVQAGAQLAGDLDAASPEPTSKEAGLAIKNLRHPVLLLQKKRVVANDVILSTQERALVISGPNAGGKTVTISAVGLCALMVRCGLPIPAEPGAKLPLFDAVFSTIGDAQDLGRDLSTFSAHLTSIKEVLTRANSGALVLIDEIAADTDPKQGAALARAVLEDLCDKGARVLVTTHLDEVKALGINDDRFVNGRVGFDPKTLMPTYRLELGVAGGSNALEVAERVGLPENIINKARAALSNQGFLSEAVQKLERSHEEVVQLRDTLAREHDELTQEKARLQAELGQLAAERRTLEAKVHEELAKELGARREEMTKLIAELQHQPTIKKAQESRARVDELLHEQEMAAARKRSAGEAVRDDAAQLQATVQVGVWVKIPSLGKEGKVKAIEGKSAMVEIGALHTRVKLQDLVPLAKPTSTKQERATPKQGGAAALLHGDARCDVRGMRADEAMNIIERFLDNAYLSGPNVVLLVHGHGTGALKQMIRDALSKSPYVESTRSGDRHEGGDGVTVVHLRGS